MLAVFYLSAAVAVVSTLLVILQRNAVHALLYLILSLLAVAVIFFLLGAPFVAALEVIVYAGAIMILFVFTVMMLNLGAQREEGREVGLPGGGSAFYPRAWILPAVLALVLLVELIAAFAAAAGRPGPAPAAPLPAVVPGGAPQAPREFGRLLYGPYVLGVELASLLLLAGLVGAYHLGRRAPAPAGAPGRGKGEPR